MEFGKKFKIFTPTENTASFIEESKVDADGKYLDQSLNFFVPGDTEELAWMVSHMMNKRYILIFKDFSGNYRILGSKLNPMKFTSNHTTGDGTGRNGYTFTFYGADHRKACFYNGNIADIINTENAPDPVEAFYMLASDTGDILTSDGTDILIFK